MEQEIRYSIDELKELTRKDLQSKGYLVKWIFAHTNGMTVGVRHLTNLNGDDEVFNLKGDSKDNPF